MPSPDLLRLRVRATSSLWARAHGTGHHSFIYTTRPPPGSPASRLQSGRAVPVAGRWNLGGALGGRVNAEGLERRVEPWRRPAAGTGARVAASRLQGAQSCPGPPRLNARRGGYGIRTPADFSWLDLSFASSPQGLHIIPQGCVSPDIPF